MAWILLIANETARPANEILRRPLTSRTNRLGRGCKTSVKEARERSSSDNLRTILENISLHICTPEKQGGYPISSQKNL